MNKPEKTRVCSGFFVGFDTGGGGIADDFGIFEYGFSCQHCPGLLVFTFDISGCRIKISAH
ncbi:MAG: hypothetical protein WD071_03680 [Pseudohongiella sp.]|uniref:hypothetical protein n=1 Tax=Pseudohongiella sp. TaxID=1979412 RepID=UPI00349FD6A5